MRFLLFYVLPLALTLYALIDCVRTDDGLVKGLPKIVWVLLIVLFPVLGSLAWIVAGRERSWERPARPAPPRMSAPDDDPDFLRDLDLDLKRDKPRSEDDPA